jgi:2',3'-cyclic-nucleotide 2'-phosphodiesterase (5'-nucleotidase family)
LIVGGHTHTPLAAPVQHGATWIVQAGALGTSLGHVELEVEDGALNALTGTLYPVTVMTPIDPTVSAVVELVEEEARK